MSESGRARCKHCHKNVALANYGSEELRHCLAMHGPLDDRCVGSHTRDYELLSRPSPKHFQVHRPPTQAERYAREDPSRTGRWTKWPHSAPRPGPDVCETCFEAVTLVEAPDSHLYPIGLDGRSHFCPGEEPL